MRIEGRVAGFAHEAKRIPGQELYVAAVKLIVNIVLIAEEWHRASVKCSAMTRKGSPQTHICHYIHHIAYKVQGNLLTYQRYLSGI